MKAGERQIAENLRLLHEDGETVEIRTLVTGKKYATYRYFDSIDEAAKHAAKEDAPGKNVYQTFNVLSDDLMYRDGSDATKDHEVTRRRWLMVDVDPQRVAGVSASDEEKGRALETACAVVAYLRKSGWPDPHVFDSGNGYHVFYRLDLPNDGESEALAKGALEGLAFLFNSEEVEIDAGVSNASRITAVYGTVKRKGKDGKKRPHRRSGALSRAGDGVATADQLRALAPPKPDEPKTDKRRGFRIDPTDAFDVPAWIEERGVPVKKSGPYQGGHRWILEECPEQGHTDNSAYIIQFASGAISAGCSHNSCRGGRGDNAWHLWRSMFDPDWRPYEESRNGHRATGSTGNDGNDSNDSAFGDLRDLPDPQEFPVWVLPPSVAQLVREAAKAIGCPVDFLAMSVLACMSAAIGDARRVLIKNGWTEGAALYAMIVGGAASKKSPALFEATRPVLDMQLAMKAEYERQKEEYVAALANWDRDADPDGEPKKPALRRTYLDDVTTEKLADTLNENPRGVCLIKDELSGWLGGMDQYKQGGKGADRQRWLQIHTNRPIAVDRKSSDEPVIVPRPFVTIVGGIQPEVLPDFGKDRGDGMMERFVAAYPPPRVSRWTDDEISEGAREAYADTIKALYRLEHAEHDGSSFSSKVEMSKEAKAAFVAEYDRLHEEMETPGFPSRLLPVYGKLEAYLARFALILAMGRCAEASGVVGRHAPEKVIREDMEGAAALLAYFKNHARRVYTGLYGDSSADNLAADLREFLVSRGGQWEGIASELFEAFESEHKPARPEDLSKAVRAIDKRSPLLELIDLPRTAKARPFRLTLKNAVTAVTAVTADAEGEEAGLDDAEDVGESADIPDAADATHEDADPVRAFLADPPEWFVRQAAVYANEGRPERLLNPLANALVSKVYGGPQRWREALPAVQEWVGATFGERA